MIGASLNQYRITASIGAGGMGEVFRARDTRLNRDVAVKVLPKDFAADADRQRRFEQEAKTLAALNHPNILTIHDAGVHEGAPYLVSELLRGKTLREEMANGALPVRKATDYALQIAQGLAAAHGKGIVHRDLKPENIFVTQDGRVKILDFGLAKLRENPKSEIRNPKPGEAATIRIDADAIINTTQPGMVLGTPAYMAPEQVRGEPADHRADIFAFGCVLYEMLSGTRAFRRDTPVESMNAVLNDTPAELTTTNPRIPTVLVRIVERCLEKQPDNRFHSAKDLAFALAETASAPSAPANGRALGQKVWKRAALLVGILLLVTLGVWVWMKVAARSHLPANTALNLPAVRPETNRSVAVLPFVNLSPDQADEYLSDGMTEELLNALAKLKGLRVPGRSSSFAFKGKTEQDIFRKVGEQLNVRTVLEGSVRKAGTQLRITAQLINVADGFHLWSETYDRDMTNIFAIQSDIAARVAEALKVQLLDTTAQPTKPTENLEAYKLYLRGRQLWNRRESVAMKEAIELFNQAIAADPTYALAYAGLADCYVVASSYTDLPPSETGSRARAATLKAIELDDTLGEPHAALGMIKADHDCDWAGAEAEFRRAIELNPNYATAHHWLGIVYEVMGRCDEAVAELRRAQELDPLSSVIGGRVGLALCTCGKLDLGIEVLQKHLALEPKWWLSHQSLAQCYFQQGKLSAAIEELETAKRISGSPSPALGFLYARAGRTNEAREVMQQLRELPGTGVDEDRGMALIEHGLGNDDKALELLEKAAENRGDPPWGLAVSPYWRDLRPHPRVQAILRKMNLVK